METGSWSSDYWERLWCCLWYFVAPEVWRHTLIWVVEMSSVWEPSYLLQILLKLLNATVLVKYAEQSVYGTYYQKYLIFIPTHTPNVNFNSSNIISLDFEKLSMSSTIRRKQKIIEIGEVGSSLIPLFTLLLWQVHSNCYAALPQSEIQLLFSNCKSLSSLIEQASYTNRPLVRFTVVQRRLRSGNFWFKEHEMLYL